MKYSKTTEQFYSPHILMITAAERSLKNAESEGEDSGFYDLLATILFSALALEALLNAVGAKCYGDEWLAKYERRETSKNKLILISENLCFYVDFQTSPWNDMTWLKGIRDKFAHGKPENLGKTVEITEQDREERKPSWAAPKFETDINLKNAMRALKFVAEVRDILYQKLPEPNRHGILFEQYTSMTSPIFPNPRESPTNPSPQ